MLRRPFIVLEGPDKSGKSTQAALLTRYLKKSRIPFVHTREPGGTSFAEAIRRVLLNPRHKVEPLAELFLYEAARAQHTKEKLLPALRERRAKTVVVMGLLETLYDEQVPVREARRLLLRMLQGLRRAQRAGASVLVLCRRPSYPVGERRWWPTVKQNVDHARFLPENQKTSRAYLGEHFENCSPRPPSKTF